MYDNKQQRKKKDECTYTLQWYDVFVRKLVPGDRIHHVLLDQLLNTLLGHHGTAGHSVGEGVSNSKEK